MRDNSRKDNLSYFCPGSQLSCEQRRNSGFGVFWIQCGNSWWRKMLLCGEKQSRTNSIMDKPGYRLWELK
jgi:hypothetical protein